MSVKRWVGAMLVLAGLSGFVPAVFAQDEGGLQILTSDLALDNEVDSGSLTVNFVIVSNSEVTQVVIDGEPQQITPSDTVTVTKQFQFTKQLTLVTISATDKEGKTRDRSYRVHFKGAPEEKKLSWNVAVKGSYEIDGNPTQDLSSPISLGDTEIKGVVKDSEQPDTRITLQASGSVTYGQWTGFLGYLTQSYSKADNDGLKTDMTYLGGSGRFDLAGTRAFLMSYVFTDLNIGGNDYAQMHTLSPAYESRSEDNKGFYKYTFGLDYTLKDFASSTQKDGGQYALRLARNRANPGRNNNSDLSIAYGTSTEGIKELDYSYFAANADWINRADSGLRFDIGMGWEYRNFPDDKQPLSKDTPLGATRVDTLWRFSTGLGWQINPRWAAMFNYRYTTDLSNKAPYVRPIYGVTVDGAF